LASFRFKAKMMAVFCFFFVLFSLRSIFVSLQISTFRIDVKQVKKALFSHRSQKNFASVSLHFASKRKWRRTLILVKGYYRIRHPLGQLPEDMGQSLSDNCMRVFAHKPWNGNILTIPREKKNKNSRRNRGKPSEDFPYFNFSWCTHSKFFLFSWDSLFNLRYLGEFSRRHSPAFPQLRPHTPAAAPWSRGWRSGPGSRHQ
jgi:hypothetical protein